MNAVFDFTDLDAFATGVPHGALARLRRETPVYWNPRPTAARPHDGFWLLTAYRDVVQVEKNPSLFSSHGGLTIDDAPPAQSCPAAAMVRDGLTHLDPPAHTRHRQLVAPSFTPLAMAEMEARIRAVAIEVIDDAHARRDVDFASEVALRLPVAVVLGDLCGLPTQDFARLVSWSDVIVAPRDPELPRAAGVRVVQELYDYARTVAVSRREQPQKDVLTLLAQTKAADGTMMSDETFVRYFWSLVTGAFDTTASAIAGGVLAFIERPLEYARLLANPELVQTAVEEVLRWETPTIYFRRTATAETEIHGRRIARGARVVMCYAAANRDSEVFANPDVFDLGRDPNNHLSFGHGPHFCLGSSLARAEIRILFEEIVQRRLRFVLRGQIRRARSNFQNRIKQMPVTIADW